MAKQLRFDEEARQKELATLLSGETLTDTALAHAKKLMDKVENQESEAKKHNKGSL